MVLTSAKEQQSVVNLFLVFKIDSSEYFLGLMEKQNVANFGTFCLKRSLVIDFPINILIIKFY